MWQLSSAMSRRKMREYGCMRIMRSRWHNLSVIRRR
jgi:hypothetical protein